jgi:hypothetical protein
MIWRLAIILLISIYIYLYNAYYTRPSFKEIPYSDQLIADIHIPYRVKHHLHDFSQWNIQYFKNKYGKEQVYICIPLTQHVVLKIHRLLRCP